MHAPLPGISSSGFPTSTPSHTADEEGKLEFRTQTILIQVPAVVTDKSGNHLHGLTKDVFHIFENGREQKISTSEEIVTAHTRLRESSPTSLYRSNSRTPSP